MLYTNRFYAHHFKSFHNVSHIRGFTPTQFPIHECVGTHRRAHTGRFQHVLWCVVHLDYGPKRRNPSPSRYSKAQNCSYSLQVLVSSCFYFTNKFILCGRDNLWWMLKIVVMVNLKNLRKTSKIIIKGTRETLKKLIRNKSSISVAPIKSFQRINTKANEEK